MITGGVVGNCLIVVISGIPRDMKMGRVGISGAVIDSSITLTGQ